jgi:hypothetical protein
VLPRDPPQFRIHQIDQAVERVRITIVPGREQSGDIVLVLVRHSGRNPTTKVRRVLTVSAPVRGIQVGGISTMTKLLGSLALAAVTVAVAPKPALAYEVPIQASFAVAFSTTPNAGNVTYCGGTPLPMMVEAHGNGFSMLGPLSFSLQKTSGGGLFHGCLTLTAPNGDTLTATYDAAGSAANSNHFSNASGTLTFTGGTGRFKGATGTANFTAVFDGFYPASSFVGGGTAPLQGMAFYLVEGKVSISGRGED